MSRVLVALGGHAIQPASDADSRSGATAQMRRTAPVLASVVAGGHELVLTHGNGPQVGELMREAELGSPDVPVPPMHVLGAESAGQIGYLIAQELSTALERAHSPREVVPIVSRTEVSRRDPAFRAPVKPVGRLYRTTEARALRRRFGWTMREDAGRGGWRRVVASPRPRRWLEGDAIRAALDLGLGARCVFIVLGGGGIPVARTRRGGWEGVDAVIDKDLSAALAAHQLGASTLAIVTDVPAAAVGFGTARQQWLGRVAVEDLEGYLAAGEFGAGSMGPKVAAGVEFLRAGGEFFVISDVASLSRALAGNAGTRVGSPP